MQVTTHFRTVVEVLRIPKVFENYTMTKNLAKTLCRCRNYSTCQQ